MADLQTDLDKGGFGWFDTGGTFDPHNQGPSGRKFDENYPSVGREVHSRPAIIIGTVTTVATLVLIVTMIFAPEVSLIFGH